MLSVITNINCLWFDGFIKCLLLKNFQEKWFSALHLLGWAKVSFVKFLIQKIFEISMTALDEKLSRKRSVIIVLKPAYFYAFDSQKKKMKTSPTLWLQRICCYLIFYLFVWEEWWSMIQTYFGHLIETSSFQ